MMCGPIISTMSKATFVDHHGYAWVPAPPGHPKATKKSSIKGVLYGCGYLKRCWAVAEAKYGRPLAPGEQVHHVDKNKLNDSPENLEIIPASAHAKLHWSNPRKRPGAPSGCVNCVNCGKVSHINVKRGLCNACYIRAKRSRKATGEWPIYACQFGP